MTICIVGIIALLSLHLCYAEPSYIVIYLRAAPLSNEGSINYCMLNV